jgi:hypothetical protein
MHWLASGGAAVVALYLSVAAICALSWFRGSTPERWGSTATLGEWLFFLVIQAVVGGPTLGAVSVPLLVAEFALSFGFLILAFRYASLWLGVAMVAQGCALGAHALFIARGGHHAREYAVWSNAACAVLLLSLLAGTLSSWRKRVVARRRPANLLVDQPAG